MDPSMSTKAAKVLLQEIPKTITTPSLVVDVLIPLLLEGFLVPRKLKKLVENYSEDEFNPTSLIPASYVQCWHMALKSFHTTFSNFTSSLVVAIVQKLFRTEEGHHEHHEPNSPLPGYNIHTALKKIIRTLEGADQSIETFLHQVISSNNKTVDDQEESLDVLPSTYQDDADVISRHKDLKCAFLMTWFSLLLAKFSEWTTGNSVPYPIPFKMLLQTAIQHSHSKWSRVIVDKAIVSLLEAKTSEFVVSGSHLQRSLKSLQQLNQTIYHSDNNNDDNQLSIDQFEELEESDWLPLHQDRKEASRKRQWVELPVATSWVDPIGWIPESHYDGNSACLALPSVLNHFSVPVQANVAQHESISEDSFQEESQLPQADEEEESVQDPNAVDLEDEAPLQKKQKQATGKGVRLLFSLQEIGVI